VKDGYARNYLLPQGKATRATPESLAEFEKRRATLEQAQSQSLSAAQEKGTKLDGLMVQVTQKAGVDGRLFGSVTNVDIVDALGGLGHTVEKAMVRMPDGPLKHVGEFPLTIALHADAMAHINVHVLGDTTGVQAG
jgi:large subunit ribosomal protein L9